MRSMFSGVSGLSAHQMKMDTIGNNIANVNTVGYKSQRVTFQEVFNQTLKGAASAQSGKGGTNPQQVGLGIAIGAIDTFHVRGAVQRTDNNTDLAINGDGFFILSNSSDCLNRTYTRAGNFSLDEGGNLVSSNGYKVLGYMLNNVTNTLNSSLEGIKISKAESVDASATSKVNFEGNLNSTLEKNSAADPVEWVGGTVDFKKNKYWETTTTVFDSLGGQHKLKYTFVRGLDANGTGSTDNNWGLFVYDMDQNKYYNLNDTTGESAAVNTWATDLASATYNIQFDGSGNITMATSNILKLDIPKINGSQDIIDMEVDLSSLTQFSNDSSAAVTSKDGYPQGSLDTFSIGPTGEINGIFTNGQNKIIGQIALAAFKNPSGLEKTAENMYQTTPNSGDPIFGLPDSSGLGALNPGTLEMSNVDISREFTEMITTQRGFQANSRIITTSDEMLQELVNMKR